MLCLYLGLDSLCFIVAKEWLSLWLREGGPRQKDSWFLLSIFIESSCSQLTGTLPMRITWCFFSLRLPGFWGMNLPTAPGPAPGPAPADVALYLLWSAQLITTRSDFRSLAELFLLWLLSCSLCLCGLMYFYFFSVTLMGYWEGVEGNVCVQFIIFT